MTLTSAPGPSSAPAAHLEELLLRWRHLPGIRGLVIVKSRDLERRARALRALAGLVRTGLSARRALCEWPNEAPPSLRAPVARVARRARLGDSLPGAVGALVEFGADARALSGILEVHIRLGGDASMMIDRMADSVDQRRTQMLEARAAGAGAKLSGRMVAALPALFVPMVSLSRAPLFDATGLALLGVGGAFGLIGMLWIESLFPSPSDFGDGAVLLAEAVAGTVRSGASLTGALAVLSSHAPDDVAAAMSTAARRVRLGAGWGEALSRAEEASLRGLGASLSHAQELGLPVADTLERFAQRGRAEGARRFEESIRQAPVKMMMPLTLCVLPSFILLGVAPFLRSLSLG